MHTNNHETIAEMVVENDSDIGVVNGNRWYRFCWRIRYQHY